ncbi:MAG: VRR-NUC domain-containing protein [Deltaproteobacteria bacterium]|nr:MAG: VRR-NUC domain-containing protein [Deltaproteobacteria bacterium]
MKQSEKTIERYVVKTVKSLGGLAIKGNTINSKGYPDRVIHLPGGKIGFLEIKTEGKKPTKLQNHWLQLLSGLGFKAGYADSKAGVDEFINELMGR